MSAATAAGSARPSRLVLLARPGAGKTTQACALARSLDVAHLSTGELLRREIAAASPAGLAVASAVKRGDLVPDELVQAVIGPELQRATAAGGYVLDGFPRDLAQARLLADATPAMRPQVAVSLEVSAAECRRRLLARAGTEERGDDTPATVDRRLARYDEVMRPVLDWYAHQGLLLRVDGEDEPGEVTRRILAGLR